MTPRRRTPLSPFHQGDAFDNLWALCKREGWTVGIARLGSELSLRVYRPKKAWQGCTFRPGGENNAAAELLDRLRQVEA